MDPTHPESNSDDSPAARPDPVLRLAQVSDGPEIWRLVRESGVLDVNSCYAYLLFCRDFADTCVVAEQEDRCVGFVTAYVPPTRPESVFVWQIGVAEQARGRGLAKSLLRYLLDSPVGRQKRFLEATVAPSNTASDRLFRSVAAEFSANVNVSQGFAAADFGDGQEHEEEPFYQIGPLRESS